MYSTTSVVGVQSLAPLLCGNTLGLAPTTLKCVGWGATALGGYADL
ncbi:hypothetical protein [Nostoc commune]|nr:hypothetical protein [Nostoc commune]